MSSKTKIVVLHYEGNHLYRSICHTGDCIYLIAAILCFFRKIKKLPLQNQNISRNLYFHRFSE